MASIIAVASTMIGALCSIVSIVCQGLMAYQIYNRYRGEEKSTGAIGKVKSWKGGEP